MICQWLFLPLPELEVYVNAFLIPFMFLKRLLTVAIKNIWSSHYGETTCADIQYTQELTKAYPHATGLSTNIKHVALCLMTSIHIGIWELMAAFHSYF